MSIIVLDYSLLRSMNKPLVCSNFDLCFLKTCRLTEFVFSLAILYSCFSVMNIFAPAVVSIVRPAASMFLGGTTYL